MHILTQVVSYSKVRSSSECSLYQEDRLLCPLLCSFGSQR